MNGYQIALFVLSGFMSIFAFIFMIGHKVLLLRLRAFFVRKRGRLLVQELRKDRTNNYGLALYEKGKVSFSKRTYGITKAHISLNHFFGISTVTVSEETGASIDPDKPKDSDVMSPQLVNELVMEAILGAVGEKLLKMIQIGMVIVGVLVLVMLVQSGVIYMMYSGLQDAGVQMSLNFG